MQLEFPDVEVTLIEKKGEEKPKKRTYLMLGKWHEGTENIISRRIYCVEIQNVSTLSSYSDGRFPVSLI